MQLRLPTDPIAMVEPDSEWPPLPEPTPPTTAAPRHRLRPQFSLAFLMLFVAACTALFAWRANRDPRSDFAKAIESKDIVALLSTIQNIDPATAHRTLLPAVSLALRSSDPDIRFMGLHALLNMLADPEINPAPILPDLVGALADPDPAVRYAALLVVRATGAGPDTPAVIPLLIRSLGQDLQREDLPQTFPREFVFFAGPNPLDQLRRTTIETLAQLGPAALPALTDALSSNNSLIATGAALALANLGPPAVPPLTTALSSNNPRLRQAAADALAELGPPAKPAIPQLRQALYDPDPAIRHSADLAIYWIEKTRPSAATSTQP